MIEFVQPKWQNVFSHQLSKTFNIFNWISFAISTFVFLKIPQKPYNSNLTQFQNQIILPFSKRFKKFLIINKQINKFSVQSPIVRLVIPVYSICMIRVFPIHSTSIKKDTESSVIFLQNVVLIPMEKRTKGLLQSVLR